MTNQQSASIAVEKVMDALHDLDGETRTGAQLHSLIKQASPGIDIREIVEQPVGPGALTKFIERYLSSAVRRIGMRGGDVLYSIGSSGDQPSAIVDAGIWKAFVSPSAVNYLCLQKSDMSLFVSGFERDDEEVATIPKATGEEHDEIRATFIESISAEQREGLETHTNGDSSYDAFASALRSIGIAGKWGQFRRVAFRDLLAKRLKSIAISDEHVPAILSQFGAAQNALHKSIKAKKVDLDGGSGSPIRPNSSPMVRNETEDARNLAQAVIANLSYDELRAINIPFGAVLDAVRGRK